MEPTKHWSVEPLQIVLQIVIVIGVIVSNIISVLNREKIQNVENRQIENREKAEEATHKTNTNINRIESTVSDTLGPQLWATTQYLQQIANETGKIEDRIKANEAQKAYHEHIRRQTEKR